MSKLPTKDEYIDSLNAINCNICSEDYDKDHVPTKMDCGHVFGYHCIIKWFETKNEMAHTCPECRRELFFPDEREPETLEDDEDDENDENDDSLANAYIEYTWREGDLEICVDEAMLILRSGSGLRELTVARMVVEDFIEERPGFFGFYGPDTMPAVVRTLADDVLDGICERFVNDSLEESEGERSEDEPSQDETLVDGENDAEDTARVPDPPSPPAGTNNGTPPENSATVTSNPTSSSNNRPVGNRERNNEINSTGTEEADKFGLTPSQRRALSYQLSLEELDDEVL